MKAIFKILLWLVGAVVALVLVGFFLPKTVYVERSVSINAKAAAVYGLLNNLTTYDKWMPWNQLDPNWIVEYGSQTKGTGAWYKWKRENSKVGIGKLTINESVPNEKVITKMEFEGSKEPSFGGWEIKPDGDGTNLKWFMNSNMCQNPINRWMGLFMNKMVGPQLESGLRNINKLAEIGELKAPDIQEPTITFEPITVVKKTVVYVTDSASSSEEVGKKYMHIIPVELGGCLKKNGLHMAGAPMAWFNGTSAPPYVFDIGVPVDKAPGHLEGRIKVKEMPGGKAIVAHFFGPYELLPKGYAAVSHWLKDHGKTSSAPSYEIYLGDPGVEKDPYKVQTDIVFPIQ